MKTKIDSLKNSAIMIFIILIIVIIFIYSAYQCRTDIEQKDPFKETVVFNKGLSFNQILTLPKDCDKPLSFTMAKNPHTGKYDFYLFYLAKRSLTDEVNYKVKVYHNGTDMVDETGVHDPDIKFVNYKESETH